MHARGGTSWTPGVIARIRRMALATGMNAPAIGADERTTVSTPDSAATTHRKANRSPPPPTATAAPSTAARRARAARIGAQLSSPEPVTDDRRTALKARAALAVGAADRDRARTPGPGARPVAPPAPAANRARRRLAARPHGRQPLASGESFACAKKSLDTRGVAGWRRSPRKPVPQAGPWRAQKPGDIFVEENR